MKNSAANLSVSQSRVTLSASFVNAFLKKISIGAMHSLDAGLSCLFSPCPPVRGRTVPRSFSRWDRK